MSSVQASDPSDRLSSFNDERGEILDTVVKRVVEQFVVAAARAHEESLEYILNDVAFAEIRRHEKNRNRKAKKKLSKWRDLAGRLGRMSDGQKKEKLEELVRFYAKDIVGNFNKTVYRFTNGVLPSALSVLLAPIQSVKDGVAALSAMEEQVSVEGDISYIKELCKKGTVIYVPTHTSNLDSVVLGFGLGQVGLPPVTYGAGKNLFSNPIISFFMYNLGAYRVDRRLQFALYKNVLKEYSTVLLEKGFHSLFFPGGTRCRSNSVEKKLKLGLLGTAVSAYCNTLLESEEDARPIYVVPMTINYRVVLEAETLIEDYLAETGKARYIIEDDEFSRLGRVAEFIRKLMSHESAVVLKIGAPLDVFGNTVDREGRSLDKTGRVVDRASYMRDVNGRISKDEQREQQYTRQLGERIVCEYGRSIQIQDTALVCRALYDELCVETGSRDIYRLTRLQTGSVLVSTQKVLERIERLREELKGGEYGELSPQCKKSKPSTLLKEAQFILGAYHTKPVIVAPSPERLGTGCFNLLYYYQNRLSHFGGGQI